MLTALLGASILAIALSAAALVLGWVNAEENYIWGSIGATALAAVLLVVAYVKSRGHEAAYVVEAEEEAARGAAIDPEIEKDRDERASQKYARATSRGPDDEDGAPTQVLAPDAPPPPDADSPDPAGAAAAATAAGATTEAPSPATGATTEAPSPEAGATTGVASSESEATEAPATEVVGIPRTKKFHRTDCRFAGAEGAEPMSRSDAEEQGYEPCGTCKP